MDRIDALGVAEWIRDERVTRVERAARGDPLDGDAWTRSRRATSRRSTEVWIGGADCPEADPQRCSSRSSACRCSTTYGLSEAPTVVTTDDLDGGHVAARERTAAPASRRADRRRRSVRRAPRRAGPGPARTTRCSATGRRPDATAETLAGGAAAHRRPRLHRRRRLSPHPRPQEPGDHPRRRERVPGGGRARAARARRRGRVRGRRPSRRASRRTRAGRGRARAGRDVDRRGAHRALPRQPREVQGAGTLGVRRRLPAQLDEQDPTPRARPPLRP